MPNYIRSPQAQAEMDTLVRELRLRYPPKPRPVKPDGMSDADFILSLQAQSTMHVLKMTDEEAAAHRNRPMISMEDAVANKDAYEAFKKDPTDENRAKVVSKRALDPDEISHVESIRRRPKNSLGQSEESSVSEEKRHAGIEAFIFTPPAKVTKEEIKAKAVGLVEYKSEPLQTEWVEVPWYKAAASWLRGRAVRRVK